MVSPMNYDYYVYSTSIARMDSKTSELEIKNYGTNTWEKVNSPVMWKRIVQEGDPVSKELAERFYSIINRQA